jgi:hypothetical protein
MLFIYAEMYCTFRVLDNFISMISKVKIIFILMIVVLINLVEGKLSDVPRK